MPDDSSTAVEPDAVPSTKITVRLTESEAERLDRHVTATGFDARTSWATHVLLRAVTDEPPFSEKELIELRQTRSEFAAVGSNLNQIAQGLNIDIRNDGPSESLLAAAIRDADSRALLAVAHSEGGT